MDTVTRAQPQLVTLTTQDPPLSSLSIEHDAHLLHNYSASLCPSWSHGDKALHAVLLKRLGYCNKDLRAITQRIHLLIKQDDSAGVYGALLDLLLILNGSGEALVDRLALKCKPFLNLAQLKFLDQYRSGLSSLQQAPFSQHSLFFRNQEFQAVLIKKVQGQAKSVSSDQKTLLIYQGFMESGELAEAIECLTQHIKQGSTDLAIHQELVDLLRQLGNSEQLQLLRNKLTSTLEQQPELSTIWYTS